MTPIPISPDAQPGKGEEALTVKGAVPPDCSLLSPRGRGALRAIEAAMPFRADPPKTDAERRTDALIAKRAGYRVTRNKARG